MLDYFKSSKRVLEPHERISEVLFGLIMVLTFTGSLSVAEAGREDVRIMLIGALGCNLAWGIIDGVLYLMGSLAETGRKITTLAAVRNAKDPEKAQRLIIDALPPLIASVLQPPELDSIRERLILIPQPAAAARLGRRDYIGAFGIFLIVFLSTLPVALPFMVIHQPHLAMRISNLVAVVMLFIAGYAYGRCVGRSPIGFGIVMVVLGIVLVGITMALGG